MGDIVTRILVTQEAQRSFCTPRRSFLSLCGINQMMDACGFDFSKSSSECDALQSQARSEAGNSYIYNVYDRLEGNERNGVKSWLKSADEWQAKLARDGIIGAPDGYPCGMEKLVVKWLNLPEVRRALHVPQGSFYGAPVGLYPSGKWEYHGNRDHLRDVHPTLIGDYRTLIYN